MMILIFQGQYVNLGRRLVTNGTDVVFDRVHQSMVVANSPRPPNSVKHQTVVQNQVHDVQNK